MIKSRKKLLLMLGLVYAIINFLNLVNQEIRLQTYQVRLDSDLIAVRQEQENLQKSLHYYQTTSGIEELARKRLGYCKKNEIPIRVIEATATL